MIGQEQAVFSRKLDVSRETLDLFRTYEQMLRRWNNKINLVSRDSMEQLWDRHFLDSAQLWELSPKRGLWLDLGSGGGFPGVVIAIMSRDRENLRVVLVESDQRKAAFLRAALREMQLDARVIAERIERLEAQDADVLSARALAPLSKLLEFAQRHRRSDGVALFPKGERVDAEIADALENWRFDCQKHPSITDARSTVLSVGEISRV